MPGAQTTTSAVARRPRTGRGIAAAVLSLVVPGLGQVAVGARRRGALLLAVTLVLVVAGRQLGQETAAAVELLLRPGGLALVVAVNLLLVGFRVFAMLDAFRIGAGGLAPRVTDRSATVGVVGAVTVLVAVALVPHAVAVHYAMVAQDTLRDVFPGGSDDAPSDASPAGDDVHVEGDGGHAEGDDVDAEGDGPGTSSPGTDATAPWLDEDRLTVAVLGSDAHPNREGHRIDAMMVVSVELDSGDATIISIERHLRDFPMPADLAGPWDRYCRDAGPGWELLNAMYRCGDEIIPDEVAALYPDAPDPAAAAVADVLGELLDVMIDHYVMVDMAGFVEAVDALGGVRIDIDGRPDIDRGATAHGCDWHDFDVQANQRHLDGEAALELVREREGTNEADRMGRQRCLLISMARQADAPTLFRRFEQLARVSREHVRSSIPLRDLPAVIELVQDLEHDRIETLGLHRPDHVAADATPRLELIREQVDEVLGDRPSRPLATPHPVG